MKERKQASNHNVTPIHPFQFLVEMQAFWTRPRTQLDQYGIPGLGNVYTPALGEVWQSLAAALNTQIADHDDAEERHRHSVYGPECGVGKTVGAAVAISMLDPLDHPGVLYVCQRKVQANEVAALVNARAGQGTAFAYHEDSKCSPAEMQTYPVLVMTHSMFGNVAEALLDHRPLKVAYCDFTEWRYTGRKLCIVDEAFQLVEDYEVHPERLAEIIGSLKGNHIRRQEFAKEIVVLETVLDQALNARDRRAALRGQSIAEGHEPDEALRISSCAMSPSRSPTGPT